MPIKRFAFVLMPFEDAFRDVYVLGIKPACEEAGYYLGYNLKRLSIKELSDARVDLVYLDPPFNSNADYYISFAFRLPPRPVSSQRRHLFDGNRIEITAGVPPILQQWRTLRPLQI